MSPLARRVLADPNGKAQLRTFLASRTTAAANGPTAPVIEFVDDDGPVRVRPKVVPKAA